MKRALTVLFLIMLCVAPSSFAKWEGVDDKVIGKFAPPASNEEKEDSGDLALFGFALAGAIGGFGAGYFYRTLTEKKSGDDD